MDDPQLRSSLEQLNSELSQSAGAEQDRRAVLASVHADVQQLLVRPDNTARDEHRSLRERLVAVIPTLEASHPTLTTTMSQVVDMLDRMGL